MIWLDILWLYDINYIFLTYYRIGYWYLYYINISMILVIILVKQFKCWYDYCWYLCDKIVYWWYISNIYNILGCVININYDRC